MKEVRKVIALLLALVMVSAAVTPAMAANSEKSARGCNAKPNKNVDTTELKGSEKDKVIEKAVKNDEVRKLAKQLREEGYTQESVKAHKALVKAEDGSASEVLVVGMVFQSDEEKTKSLTYAYNTETGDTVVTLGTGWDCTLCATLAAACGVCAAACLTGAGTPGCVVCLLSACPGAAYECSCCCCGLTGDDYCCGVCEF